MRCISYRILTFPDAHTWTAVKRDEPPRPKFKNGLVEGAMCVQTVQK